MLAAAKKRTAAMRNHTLPPNLLQTLLLNQAPHRMERAPHFERAYALEVLALEEQPQLGFRRLLALPLRAAQRINRLRG